MTQATELPTDLPLQQIADSAMQARLLGDGIELCPYQGEARQIWCTIRYKRGTPAASVSFKRQPSDIAKGAAKLFLKRQKKCKQHPKTILKPALKSSQTRQSD